VGVMLREKAEIAYEVRIEQPGSPA
jgi:hypothetical protein